MQRILVANRQKAARNAIQLYLSQYGNEWQVVAGAGDQAELLSKVSEHHPDIVALHINIAEQPLKNVIASIRSHCPNASVLVSSGDDEQRLAALRAGADAFMYLGDPPSKLISQLRILAVERVR